MSFGHKIMKILGIDTERRKIGDKGEDTAAKFLKKHGYRILERNYVAHGYEIDIIAVKGDTVVFVEVKTRTVGECVREYRPASAVTPEKQRKILKAAAAYKGYNPSDKKMRFDVIEVYIRKTEDGKDATDVKHLVGTFDRDTAYAKRFHTTK